MCIKRAAALLSFGTRNRPKERSNVGGGNPNVELLVTIIGSVHQIQNLKNWGKYGSKNVLVFLLSFFDSSSSVVSSISMHVGAGAVSKHEKESKQGSCFCVAGLRG